MALFRLSDAEREYIRGGVEDGVRGDGRRVLDYRPFTLEIGLLPQANGSCRVRLARTDILVSVKAELGEPDASAPNCGKIIPCVDLLPFAAPELINDGEKISVEMTRLLKTVFGEEAMDLTSLCVIPEKQCWILHIDCLIHDYGGNISDALCVGVKAALENTRLPAITLVAGEVEGQMEIELSDDPFETVALECSRLPIAVTFNKIGTKFVVDASVEEELCISARVTYSINKKGNICGIDKGGPGRVQPTVLLDLVGSAQAFAKVIFEQMEKITKEQERTQAKLGFFAV